MEQKSTFVDTIKQSNIQEFILGVRGYAGEITIDVHSDKILDVITYLKNEHGYTYLADISGIDHYSDEHRFEISYNLINIESKTRLRVSCRVEEEKPHVESITSLYTAADWFEREVFDMVGIIFDNHPDLRRMYMPEDYQYYPLRKEFPLLGIPGSITLPEKDPPKEYN